MRSRTDALRVLGLQPGADAGQVTHAYRALARAWHPDTNPDPAAADRLAHVVDAYRFLNRATPPATGLSPPDPDPGPPTTVHPEPVTDAGPARRPRGATVVAGPVRIHPLPRH